MDERQANADLSAFERQMRRRRLFFLILSLIGSLIGVALSIGLAVMKISDWIGSRPPPPAIEVDVDAGGRISVRGCGDDLETCVRAASDRENNRPGGGRARALLHLAPGAPQEAIRIVRKALLDNEFTPEGH